MKHFISSLSVLCANTPPCEGRISSRKILSLLLILFLSIGNAWGAETDTYDFKTSGVTKVSGPNAGNMTSSSENVVLKSKTGNTTDTWTIIFTGSTAYGYGKNTGIYFGTSSYAPNAQMTSKSYNYVSQVDIVTTTSNTSYKIGVKVGGSSFGEKTFGSCTSQTQTFTSDATTGAITISVTSSNKKQVKIEKVIITYGSAPATPEPEPEKTATSLVWSQTEYAVTMGETPTFPTLTTTPADLAGVTYSSSNGTVATIAADGTITIKAAGETTIKASYAGNETYAAATDATYKLTVNKAPATPTDNVYVKVTSTEGITDGDYLIVYEDASNATPAPVAFDGSLENLDAVSNNIAVTITDGTIAGNTDIDAATFKIASITDGYSIQSKSGKYIGKTATGNGLNTDKTTAYTNTITVDAGKNAVVVSSGGPTLRYNKASDQARFRYYGSGQQAIALYKKASKHTVTIADCTNGSVSATGVNNGDQVLSGTQITLSNTPATGHKLAAYDVYKTGDNTTEVTVTDGKFIMPEFDVTISATFELAKTLTSIEITNNATQTTFWQGETFNSTGLKVTAHFDGAADEDVTDKVTVTGSTATAGTQTVTVSYKEGAVSKDATYTITVKAIPNTKETAYTVADAFDIIDKLTTAEGVYVAGIVSEIVTAYNSQYGNISYNISADGLTTSDQLLAYRGKSYNGENFTSDDDIQVGDEVVVKGNLKLYGGTYEFDAGNQLVSLNRTKQQAGLSYTTTEYNVNLGEAFIAPTLNNPNSLAVTYSSNNEDVATVAADGAVTIKAAGTVVITASFAGDEDYVAGEASYTINVTDPNVSSVTFDATVDIPTEGLTLTKNGVSMTFTGGAMDNGENYRCYSGQKMTISYADGNITKIVLECTTNNDAKYGPGCFETETASYSYSGKVGTWTGEAKSITFNAKDQVRMTTVTVYYKQDTRTPAGIAWNPATVSLTVGDAFTAPTFSNPNSLTGITFASDNEALATVNAGVISLVSGKTGIATITATYAGNETYKPAEVTCVVTVSPKSEKVVILAEYNGQWYAMTGAYVSGKTNVLSAIPVEYINGTLYNVAEADKASIEWQLAIDGTVATFKNGDNYLTGGTNTDLTLETTEFEWDYNGVNYLCNDGKRTFLYCENTKTNVFGFKNYAISNAGSVKSNSDGTTESYSSTPVVTAPVYETATFYTRTVTPGNYGTICLPYASDNFTGATFFKVAGKEGNKIVFDEVTALEAGKPYIFLAEATEIKVAQIGESAVEAGKSNSLQGTFSEIEPAENNILTGNYMVVNNVIKKCGANCGLAANRAYFIAGELDNLGTPFAPAPSVRRISMGVTGQNTATGVDQVQGDNVPTKMIINGQLYILRGEKMYDAQGKLVK